VLFDLLQVNKLSTDDVVHESATLPERWPSIAPDDKRKVVEASSRSSSSVTEKST
jgi:hypothetical protein